MENRLLKNNKQAIKEDLDKLLKIILMACIILFFSLIFVSKYTEPSFVLLIVYSCGALVCIISYLAVLKSESYYLHLFIYYTVAVFAYGFFIYIGAIIRPDATGTSIIVLLALLPLLIPDSFLRVNGFLLLFYASYIGICLYLKPFNVAIDDLVNATSFTTIGFLLGNNYRHIKLISFDIQRESKENEHMDFLTGLPNRRLMYIKMSNSEKNDCPISINGVMMMDIDHFKLYNDNKGHLKGDLCLKELSKLFAKISVEKNIEIFRYGGEEFVAFYYGHDEEKLNDIAYFILEEVRKLNIEFKETKEKIVTLSLGYTYSAPEEKVGTSYLIDIADKALYLAKNSGRNTIKRI